MGGIHRNLDIICHQIRSPDNLGAIARLMANFGFSRLVLSEPVTTDFVRAGKLAVGGESVLTGITLAADLRTAVQSSVYAVGTTSRGRLKRRAALSPEEAMERLVEASHRGRVALVLGGEKRGLSDEELALCQDVLVVPTSDTQPSMNLSQAVAVLLYLAARANRPAPKTPPGAPPASLGALHALEARWREILLQSGFLNPQAPEHVLGELTRTLARAQLTQREAELWLSAGQHIKRGLGKQ